MSKSEAEPSRPRSIFDEPYRYQPATPYRTIRRVRSFDDYLKDVGQDNSRLVTFEEIENGADAELLKRQNAAKRKALGISDSE